MTVVVFDMDGVLLRSMPLHCQAWQRAGAALGLHIDPRDIYRREGESGATTARALAPPGQHHELLRWKERLFADLRHRVKPYPGAVSLLQWLQRKACRLGLVTGTSRAELQLALPARMANCFHASVAGDEVRYGKPHPAAYRRVCRALRVRPRDVLVVENARYGIEAARRAGIGRVMALATTMPRSALRDADGVFRTIRELHLWLRTHDDDPR